jgi:hypothetical protein
MLYGASPDRYRDHIAHVFRVWVIGHRVLKNKNCFKGVLFSDEILNRRHRGRQDSKEEIHPSEWECMWAIAALCHDLGYPLSHIDQINSSARDALRQMGLVHGGDLRFSFSLQMLPFHDTLIRLMASRLVRNGRGYRTHLQNKYYLKLLKSFGNLEHGIVSSLLVSKALVYFLESDLCQDGQGILDKQDARQFIIRREILKSMAAHTCQDIYHLRFDTLSFLLYVIDEIQCWGRPTLEELQHQAWNMPASEAEVIFFEPKRVAVIIHTGAEDWSKKQHDSTEGQLSKLYRMLRLGVDTSKLRDRYLEFAVVPDRGMGMHLLLKDGRISLEDVDAVDLDCRRA